MHVISVDAQTDKHRKRKAILGLAVPALCVRLAGKLTEPNVEFPEMCLEGKLRCLKYEITFLQDIHVRISGNLGQQGSTHSSTDTV